MDFTYIRAMIPFPRIAPVLEEMDKKGNLYAGKSGANISSHIQLQDSSLCPLSQTSFALNSY